MNLILRCLRCKKYSKKNKDSVNESNIIFNTFINQEPNLQQNISINIDNQVENKEGNVNQNNNVNSKEQNKKEILIDMDNEEDKYKKTNEKLIIDEKEKSEIEEKILLSKYGLNLNKEIDFDEPLLKTDSPLISDYEKTLIFTKGNLISLFDKLWNLDKFKKVWDKDNLFIEIRTEGTEINNQFYLIKLLYRQIKAKLKSNADIETLIDFIYIPSLRLKWDKIFKSLDIYDGNNESNYVVNSIAKSPVFIMSERESIEKRFIFKSKDGNAYYIMSSSVPDDLFPEKKDIIRITNFINYYKIVDAGDYIEFYSLNQTDFKMPIPQFLINVTLPTTTKNWQIYLENFANEAKYDKIRKTIIQNNDNNEERENKNT